MSNFFLTFDNSSGEIIGIENVEPQDISYITATLEQVTPFLEGTESTTSYSIMFDTQLKEYILKPRVFEETLYTSPKDIFYEIPWQDQEADINVRYQKDTDNWKIYLGSDLAKSLKEQKSVLQNEITFFITSYKNPNLLIDTITVMPDPNNQTVVKIKNNPSSKFSVYTKRRFETYGVNIAI